MPAILRARTFGRRRRRILSAKSKRRSACRRPPWCAP